MAVPVKNLHIFLQYGISLIVYTVKMIIILNDNWKSLIGEIEIYIRSFMLLECIIKIKIYFTLKITEILALR